jgi:hypothetical protein
MTGVHVETRLLMALFTGQSVCVTAPRFGRYFFLRCL